MAYVGKLLNPIRLSLSLLNNQTKSITQSRQLLYCGFEPLRSWRRNSLQPFLRYNVSRFQHKLNIQRNYIQNFSLSGKNSFIIGIESGSKRIGSVFGVSVAFGSICFRPHVTYAMDGQDVLLDDYAADLSGSSETQEDVFAFWTFVKKFWPVFFLLTVLVNWDHPIALGMKLILLLFSTKPSPLSVYIYVQQFCHLSMRQKPHLYLFKNLYANKVEVQDYKLLCIARVEVGNQKLTLVGILGGWWALPSPQGVISTFRELLRDKKSSNLAYEFTEFKNGFC